MTIIRVTTWVRVVGVINLLTKSPDPPSKCQEAGSLVPKALSG